ncbi:hypothetical protein GCM10011584_32430 [Nocardioides phosphati]|uniref:FHA domain-containing protein n=1 Tax=Nocardioides phosphati TaxID=1867775 RepID=A0ABQ2ND73_9ACTN|nr:FHA domain-containing protein [Nocardioides phosphati]GGO93525.1 hypothetical protein GCM10011584_32430 [Nocardioides phosphati]
MTTTFTPGAAVAICGESARMLAGIPIDDARLPQLWDAVRPASATAVDGVLQLLLAEGFDAMPAFAVVASDGDATRVVVRHPAVVEAVVDGAPRTLEATPGGTWSDVTITGATSLVLRADGGVGTTVQLPLHVGVTQAGAVTVTLGGVAPVVQPAPASDVPAPEPKPEAEVADVVAPEMPVATPPAAESPVAAESPAQPEAAPEPDPEPEPEPDPLAARAQTFHALLTSDTSDRDALLAQMSGDPDDDAAGETPAESAPEDEEPATSLTAVWKADEPAAPAESAGADASDSQPAAAEAGQPAAASAPSGGGLIDGVPWLSGSWKPAPVEERPAPRFETPERPTPPPPPRPPVAPEVRPRPSGDQEREQQTLNRAELLRDLGSAGIVGPSVLAVDCPAGHPTPAHEPTCRLCGKPVSESQEPRQIARPALGALVLANGDRLVLDKDAVLGRAPFEPEGATERPHLLRVGDSGEISRQHARITLDGWHVIVRDLGTANGTTLTLPGGSPQQLRANEDYQLEDGAEIGIADIVTLRYEVTP